MVASTLRDLAVRPSLGRIPVSVYGCVRNEIERIPYFLNYHRKLGVESFVFVDNASSDGTSDYLLEQADCSVLRTDQSYAASRYGVDWINELLDRFCEGRWALVLDVDELLVYPHCERLSLSALIDYFEGTEAQGMRTFLLDMYADAAIRNVEYCRGAPFTETCPYFDTDSYDFADETHKYAGVPLRGGPRRRLFWDDPTQPGEPPLLAKTPLVKWRSGLRFRASTHIIPDLKLASVTGVLLHFKFFSDFYQRAKEETERSEHWDNAAQYHAYWSVLRKRPDLNPFYERSVRYRDSAQLLNIGLIRAPSDYPGAEPR